MGGAGYLKTGHYLKLVQNPAYEAGAPHNKLLTMFRKAVDIDTDAFGGERGGAGEFEELKA